jgi:hypothetical protein
MVLGVYLDRRSRVTVNCSNTIWALATNVFDQIIHQFCDNHGAVLFADHNFKAAEERIRKLTQRLSRQIQEESFNVFGVSIHLTFPLPA